MSQPPNRPKTPRSAPTPDPNKNVHFIDEPTNEPILLPPTLIGANQKRSSGSLLNSIAVVIFLLVLISGSWVFGFWYAKSLYDSPQELNAECNNPIAAVAQAPQPRVVPAPPPLSVPAASTPVSLPVVAINEPKSEPNPKEEKSAKPKEEKPPKEEKLPKEEKPKEEKPKEEKPKEEKPAVDEKKEPAGTLTKAQINATLKKAPLSACSIIGSGKVQLVITINSSGAVQSASGADALGACVAKKVQGLSFPAITAPSQTFTATAVVP